MKFFISSPVFIFSILLFTCKNETKSGTSEGIVINKKNTEAVKIIPINHGTLVLESGNHVIYVDPVGGADAFSNQKRPTLVLITDIHGDHFSIETLKELGLNDIAVVAPQAVIDKIPTTVPSDAVMLANGQTKTISNIDIKAIPMYNLREEALKFHKKGRGNGYVLTLGEERIYISGDTEDIPEMRKLENIDKALVCMNLPYTMPIESAASAVLDFKPNQVIPYHYRGTEGLSDVNKFKDLVEKKDKSIEVILMKWY